MKITLFCLVFIILNENSKFIDLQIIDYSDNSNLYDFKQNMKFKRNKNRIVNSFYSQEDNQEETRFGSKSSLFGSNSDKAFENIFRSINEFNSNFKNKIQNDLSRNFEDNFRFKIVNIEETSTTTNKITTQTRSQITMPNRTIIKNASNTRQKKEDSILKIEPVMSKLEDERAMAKGKLQVNYFELNFKIFK